MPACVAVRPVERPEGAGHVIPHLGHRVAGPFGANVLSPRWTAFEDRDRATPHRCLNANAIEELCGDAFGAVLMDPREVEVGNDGHGSTLEEWARRSM